ncbi:beta-N-acetylhexosaminidase family protein [Streptomyces iconiensis]|uniref:Beta-N-acetylglucosaminidase domain-containing protein n=1 Tax=Streptomyces iconiensis TaxID=1384038 RepID=A0ABT7A9I5_9ACTN|nr:beta-N-acetylglucosaminidase domain-containing protein [Streptomyces iconiensis]MDJ1137985.1 beta-N-acetylglucosaminidase domain-containing protein [Streptomyces iconiensis]
MSAVTRSHAALIALALFAAAVPSVATAAGGPGGARGAGGGDGPPRADSGGALPVVSPTPQKTGRAGQDVRLGHEAEIVVGEGTDAAARRLLTEVLRDNGIRETDVRARPSGRARLTVLLGEATRPDVAKALRGTEVPSEAEGYGVRVHKDGRRGGTVALGGTDAAGQFYAVQTLRQLITGAHGPRRVAGASISDRPSMPLRGTIEGFYGPPWTQDERLDHMDFLGDTKANTYVYAPKDDPYHREKWRDPYPADKLAELGTLVDRARANHVRFTFAVSPGTSICYSDPGDLKALKEKLSSVYDLGVRDFSVPLDDISYTKWNCEGDQKKYGAPGRAAAAEAQVELLNAVQREFVATHEGTRPLQMVPTEYGDLTETAYKKVLREKLDGAVEVMWTGTDVVPPEITNEQAERASELFGRKVFVWDNYPVNDFDRTKGRLLLAPYDKRDPGLSGHVSGIVSNPMNQAAASKLAVFTISDFSWNDRGYDRDRSGRQAARYVAGGDPRTTAALRTFVDLNHAAPTFGEEPWQPQSPVLSGQLHAFWKKYATDPAGAVRDLRPVADGIAKAPGTLREGIEDRYFLADAALWLDATELWGDAMRQGLRVLTALREGDKDAAAKARSAMDKAATAASEITVDPEEHHQVGPVKIGAPYIADFLSRVRTAQDA